jgi:hypothetical protein
LPPVITQANAAQPIEAVAAIKRTFIFCFVYAVRFTLQQAMQQQGVAMPQFLFYFLINEIQSSRRNSGFGLVKLSQQPQVLL